jgi:hypothetical protein
VTAQVPSKALEAAFAGGADSMPDAASATKSGMQV